MDLKRIFILSILMTILAYCVRQPAYAVSCSLTDNQNSMINSACTIDGTSTLEGGGNYITGQHNGNITISGADVTIQPETTLTWAAGKSIFIQNGGRILKAVSSQMKQVSLYDYLNQQLGFTVQAASPVKVLNQNLHVCTGDPCTVAAPGGLGNLVVEGQVKITGGNPGASKVLTSDANGVATWGSTSGIATGYQYDKHRRDITTDNVVSNQLVRKGWGYITMVGAPAGYWGPVTGTVSYGITFDDIPIVLFHGPGFKSAAPAPTALSQCTVNDVRMMVAYGIGQSSFTARLNGASQSDTVTGYACYTWVAIGTYAAGYGADIAETYLTTDFSLKQGDVVAIDEHGYIRKSSGRDDANIFGIISTKPGTVLGGTAGDSGLKPEEKSTNEQLIKEGKAKVATVALAGKVPLRVTLENGKIHAGDYLTASSLPGYAMRATSPGLIIGRALESYDGNTDTYFSGEAEFDQIIQMGKNGKTATDIVQNSRVGHGVVMALVDRGFYQGFQQQSLSQRIYRLEKTSVLLLAITVLAVSTVCFVVCTTKLNKQKKNT